MAKVFLLVFRALQMLPWVPAWVPASAVRVSELRTSGMDVRPRKYNRLTASMVRYTWNNPAHSMAALWAALCPPKPTIYRSRAMVELHPNRYLDSASDPILIRDCPNSCETVYMVTAPTGTVLVYRIGTLCQWDVPDKRGYVARLREDECRIALPQGVRRWENI